ncbi:DUF2508 family protein [Paenibacillus yanchengensis]|uniref:DUF2508 family protein n=1 Tax=Paenibacillus yanchengensis TaxID=2035833 RepID=A0ABW4YPD1_9BACL
MMGQAEKEITYHTVEQLREDIDQAVREWEAARRMFHYARGEEEVDYAIYTLISCEKRYSMLLRKAKQLNLNWQQAELDIKYSNYSNGGLEQ